MWSVDPSQGGDDITPETLVMALRFVGRADSVFRWPVLDSSGRGRGEWTAPRAGGLCRCDCGSKLRGHVGANCVGDDVPTVRFVVLCSGLPSASARDWSAGARSPAYGVTLKNQRR